MGIFPVWGYQLIIGIALAHFFKLNKALFVVAAHISVPPMIPLIIFLSYHFGALLLNNPVAAGPFSKSFSLDSIKDNMLQYLVGSIALSIVAAIMFGLVAFLVLKLFPLKKKQLYTFNY